MRLKRLIAVKESLKRQIAGELKDLENRIDSLRGEIRRVEDLQGQVNTLIKNSFSEGLLLYYRSLESQKQELLKHLAQLENLKEEKLKKLKEVYRETKALELLKEVQDREESAKTISLETQQSGFMYLSRYWKKHA